MTFSHIYVEERCRELPLAKQILARFSAARVVTIEHYKEFFNRPRQSFAAQKKSVKLILAQKEKPKLYEATERVRSKASEHDVHYIDIVRNCIFDCQYCFLQGIHRTANILAFLNIDAYFHAVEEMLAKQDVFLSISYLSDLLALEELGAWNARWIDFARGRPNLVVESRTKSSNFAAIRHLRAHESMVLVWSISPKAIAQRYEYGCASLANRVFQVLQALRSGWRVRLAFDPVLLVEGWEELYRECLDYVFSHVPATQIEAVYAGVFRMHKKQLRYMQEDRPEVELLHDDIVAHRDLAHARALSTARETLVNMLERHLPAEKILFVHG